MIPVLACATPARSSRQITHLTLAGYCKGKESMSRCGSSRFFLAFWIFSTIGQSSAKGSDSQDWRVRGALAAFNDPDEDVRRLGLTELMRLDALDQIRPDAVAALLPLAPPADPWGQNSSVDAIRALKRMRAVEYAPAVAKFLDCSVEQCVIEAIAALGDLQDQQYASPLVSLLTFSSYRVAHTAAWALARMQAKQAVPDLEQLFWHPHTMPSHIGIRYGPLTNPEKAIRARAGLALAALGVRQYAAQLSQDLITADDRELFQEIAAGLILLERSEEHTSELQSPMYLVC